MKVPYKAVLFAPYVLMLLGVASNQVAVLVNAHHMPVLMPDGCANWENDFNHVCMTSQTHLKILCDWILSNDGVSSIGDLMQDFASMIKMPFLYAYIALVVHKAILKR